MILYIVLYFILLLSSFSKGKNSVLFLWLAIILIAFLVGFRSDDVGADTVTYKGMYTYLHRSGYAGYPEPLYALLNIFLANLGLSFNESQFIIALVGFSLCGLVIKKVSCNYSFSIFTLYVLYFVFYTMNIYRQLVGVYILFYAFYSLSRGKKLSFYIYCLAAACFHAVLIIAMGIALLMKKWLLPIRLNKKIVLNFLLVTFLIGALIPPSAYSVLMGRYAAYLFSDEGGRSWGRFIQSVFLSTYWSAFFYYIFKHTPNEYRNNFWLKLYLLGIMLGNVLMQLELGLRVPLMCTIAATLVLPHFLRNNTLKHKTNTLVIVTVWLSVFFFIFLLSNSAKVVPYNISAL